MALIVLLALAVGAGVAAMLTVSLQVSDAVTNLLAELAGLLAGAVTALLLVKPVSTWLERRRWIRLRDLSYRALGAHLSEIGIWASRAYHIGFGDMDADIDRQVHSELGASSDTPDPQTANALRTLGKILERYKVNQLPASGTLMKLTRQFLSYAEDDLDQIRNVLTPRILTSAVDQEVADCLVEFDQSCRRLTLEIAKQEDMPGAGDVQPEVAAVLISGGDLMEVIANRWEESR